MFGLSVYFVNSFRRVIRREMFKQIESIWLSQLRCLSIITPRSFCCSTFWITSIAIYKTICSVPIRFCRDPSIINTVSSILTYMSFDRHYIINPAAPVCNFDCSIIAFILAEWTVVPSAYISTSASFVNRGKSFIKSKNRTGPETEPCGMHDFSVDNEELTFLSTMHCCLSER